MNDKCAVKCAAAYLAGDLDTASRAEFESHLVCCESCWWEVSTARHGRSLAESLREPAPQRLREKTHALAAEDSPAVPRKRRRERSSTRRSGGRHRILAVAAATAVLGAATVGLIGLSRDHGPVHSSHDALLHAAVSVYAGRAEIASTQTAPVTRIGALALRSTGTARLDGIPVTVFRYADAGGRQVLLLRSGDHWPRSSDAYDLADGPGWLGTMEGTVIFCPENPEGPSWLVLAPSEELALQAGRAAGLRT
jgi:hypothetical protein